MNMQERTRTARRKRKKKGKGLVIFIAVLSVMAILGLFFSDIMSKVSNTIDVITQNVGNRTEQEANEIIQNAKPINVLLLGIDNGAYGRSTDEGRADTMLLLTINPSSKQSQLLSIPRDTYTEIVGNNTYDKINHAYSFGRVPMAVNSVEKLLDTTIDFYVEINMGGLMEFVDALGGIEVTSPLTFTYEGRSFVEGKTELLDGESALRFARMRYDDPEGDNGRQKRQRIVISQLVKKLMTFDSLSKYENILKAARNNVKTDIPIKHLLALKNTYGPAVDHLTQLFFEETPLYLPNEDGEEIFYFYASDEELLEKANSIRKLQEQPLVQTYPLLQERIDYSAMVSQE